MHPPPLPEPLLALLGEAIGESGRLRGGARAGRGAEDEQPVARPVEGVDRHHPLPPFGVPAVVDAPELALVGAADDRVVPRPDHLTGQRPEDREDPLPVRRLRPLPRRLQGGGDGVAHPVGGVLPVAAAVHLVVEALSEKHERPLHGVPAHPALLRPVGVVDLPVVERPGDRPGCPGQGFRVEQAVGHGAGADVAVGEEVGGVEEPARTVRCGEGMGVDGEGLGGEALSGVGERPLRPLRHRHPDLHPRLVTNAVVEIEAALPGGDLGGPVAGPIGIFRPFRSERRQRPGERLPVDEVCRVEDAEAAAVRPTPGAVGPVLAAMGEDEGVGERPRPDRVLVGRHQPAADSPAVSAAGDSPECDPPWGAGSSKVGRRVPIAAAGSAT